MKRYGINDTITFGTHKETGKYHGLFYINHPTPSGEPRLMLWHSTKEGFDTPNEAVDKMADGIKPEVLIDTDIVRVKEEPKDE